MVLTWWHGPTCGIHVGHVAMRADSSSFFYLAKKLLLRSFEPATSHWSHRRATTRPRAGSCSSLVYFLFVKLKYVTELHIDVLLRSDPIDVSLLSHCGSHPVDMAVRSHPVHAVVRPPMRVASGDVAGDAVPRAGQTPRTFMDVSHINFGLAKK